MREVREIRKSSSYLKVGFYTRFLGGDTLYLVLHSSCRLDYYLVRILKCGVALGVVPLMWRRVRGVASLMRHGFLTELLPVSGYCRVSPYLLSEDRESSASLAHLPVQVPEGQALIGSVRATSPICLHCLSFPRDGCFSGWLWLWVGLPAKA